MLGLCSVWKVDDYMWRDCRSEIAVAAFAVFGVSEEISGKRFFPFFLNLLFPLSCSILGLLCAYIKILKCDQIERLGHDSCWHSGHEIKKLCAT